MINEIRDILFALGIGIALFIFGQRRRGAASGTLMLLLGGVLVLLAFGDIARFFEPNKEVRRDEAFIRDVFLKLNESMPREIDEVTDATSVVYNDGIVDFRYRIDASAVTDVTEEDYAQELREVYLQETDFSPLIEIEAFRNLQPAFLHTYATSNGSFRASFRVPWEEIQINR